MFNFPFVDDAPQYKADTLRLFEEINAGKFKAFTSEYVMRELKDAANSLRTGGRRYRNRRRKKYTLNQGLYLIEPAGNTFNITPQNGNPKEW